MSVSAHAQETAPPAPAASPPQSEIQKWIATTDAQWKATFKRDVTDVREAELGKVKAQYRNSLEAAITKASAAGDLDGAVVLRNEQERFVDTNMIPAQDPAAEAASVKQLRAPARILLAKLETDHAGRVKALHAKYDQFLAQAQTQLTQRQRLDDALEVKAKRDEVATAWITPALSADPKATNNNKQPIPEGQPGAAVAAAAQGITFKPGDDGFIRNCLLLEPIRLKKSDIPKNMNLLSRLLDRPFVGIHKNITPKDGDKAVVDGIGLTWHAYESGQFYFDLSKFAKELVKPDNWSVFLGVFYIVCDNDIPDVMLSCAIDDRGLWRLNGKDILRQNAAVWAGREDHLAERDLSERFTLKKGINVLSMTIINMEAICVARVRIVDRSEKPVTNYTISLTPPAR